MLIEALEKYIQSGNQTYPIYVGFLKAQDLLKVAEVPNFKTTTPNQEIANNILTPPVKQWQRPLMKQKRDKIIQTFNGTGEFMPNPVLVAERSIGSTPKISVKDVMATGNIPTKVKQIEIPQPASNSEPPLWIIDGQHRITGLGDPKCAQRDDYIPVVLLLNNGGQFYNGRTLAKVFAQVTTESTPLNSLHKEWLTFAFELGKYANNPRAHEAMQSVAHLCNMPHNKASNKSNRFHDDIKFNDELASVPKFLGAHQYDCNDLAGLLVQYYFEKPTVGQHLSPTVLAEQISMAFDVLRSKVRAPHEKSVFFGKASHHHKIMCDAFLAGVLTYLLTAQTPPTESEWDILFKKLNFHQTDWNFQQHVSSSIRWVDKSKRLALDVFTEIFSNGSLPDGVSDVWDYLSGDQMYIDLEFSYVNLNGNKIKQGREVVRYQRGAKKTKPMNSRKYFKVTGQSSNARQLEIFDEKSSASDPIKFKSNGEYLRGPKVDSSNPSQNPLVLSIKVFLYGGNEERIQIALKDWL